MFISFKQFFVICFVLLKTVSGVPVTFRGADNRVYVVEINPKYNWVQALFSCNRNDAQLLVIDSKEKNEVVTNLLKEKFGKIPELWIGGHDELNTSEGKGRLFVWSPTGERMVYSHWSILNPDNFDRTEHCVHMYSSFDWNDAPCHLKKGFICECVTENCMNWQTC